MTDYAEASAAARTQLIEQVCRCTGDGAVHTRRNCPGTAAALDRLCALERSRGAVKAHCGTVECPCHGCFVKWEEAQAALDAAIAAVQDAKASEAAK